MTPIRTMPELPSQRAIERIEYARSLLVANGFLTSTESANVKHRMKKWIKRHRVTIPKAVAGSANGEAH